MRQQFSFKDIEAIIFDMDGTLWNALKSYAHIWNVCMPEFGIEGHIEPKDLLKYMGYSIDEILQKGIITAPAHLDKSRFLSRLEAIENDMMPLLGGELYPGVFDGLTVLHKHFTLMLQSNCSKNGLVNFMRYTGTTSLFEDYLSWGMNPRPKSENIRLLMKRNGIKKAVYVGDTQSDCNHAHDAAIPFVHMTYGFGECADADMAFSSFNDFVNQVISDINEQ